MFVGQFYHNLDEKSRLTIPATFREFFSAGGGAYLMRGFDQNLNLLTFASFRVISERINRMSLTDPNARQLRRLIYSDAASVEFDKTGRILIPQFLREAADINDEAVIVGAGIYVEIWSPKLWTAQRDQLKDVKVTAEQFAVFDLPAE